MVFNSFSFAVFFALVLVLYAGMRSWRGRKVLLLVASYLFYAAWNPPLVSLLALSTAVDWGAARLMQRSEQAHVRRGALLLSLTTNLGMLALFKYSSFLLENFQGGLALVGVEYVAPAWSIVLPVGISFYTFQTLSFSIDVYRRKIDPTETTFLDFAVFVAFFPQLVAGPIVRAASFLPQLKTPRTMSLRTLYWGGMLMSIGLFEKTVLADTLLARTADLVFSGRALTVVDAWAGMLAFSGQIFFDFAGYSTCAIGAAMCLGFALPDNFWFPYGASGFSDFWRRWHISLSSWLRDYLYISLGGNRQGPRRTTINLFLTMLLGGLWHGASWNFLLWGALHGGFLVAERAFRRSGRAAGGFDPKWWLITQFGVALAWIPFRAVDFPETARVLGALTGLAATGAEAVTTSSNRLLVFATVILTYGLHVVLQRHRLESIAAKVPPVLTGLLLGLAWLAIWLAQPEDRAFIYFQF